jgi:hypothetical protein
MAMDSQGGYHARPAPRSRLRTAVAVLLILQCSPGCASLAHGGRQDVAVSSDPPGAEIFIDNRHAGVTPAQVSLPRRKGRLVVRFEKEGFAMEEVALTRTLSAWLIADVALVLNPMAGQGLSSPSLWPLMVAENLAVLLGLDFLTGAAFRLPPAIRATLRPVQEF